MTDPTLHEIINLSYANNEDQQHGLKQHGYNYDSRFSDSNNQAYYNPEKKKLIFSVTGTHSADDVLTDINLGLGRLKQTQRYQDSDKLLKSAKAHYNPDDVSVSGHSLGGTIASYIAQPSDKVYSLNKGATIGQGYRDNEQHFRTSGDVVSMFSKFNNNTKTLKNKNISKDPLTSHNSNNIKSDEIFV